MDITKFLRVSKKRDLNNQSDSGEQQKKAREGSSEDNLEVGSVFTTSMDSPECLQILFNCLQNVEKSVKEIHEMQEKTQSSQIKGELQLKDLSEAVEFIAKKFDQYETERKEKEKIINNLQGKVSEISNEIEVLKHSLDRQQQYSRRNCVLIHGISEQKGEDTDEQALKIIREELGETVEKSDLDRTHRTGAFKEDKSKCRTIIVKFSKYNVRDKNKKKLKGKGYLITESLTAMRMKKLTEAHNSFGFTNVWTQDEKILGKDNNRIKVFFTNCVQRNHLKVFLKNSCS